MVTVTMDEDERDGLREMAKDMGLLTTRDLLVFLVKCWRDGGLLVINRAAKETVIGASEERILKKVARKAREETLYVLYERGLIADPYER